MHRYEMIGRTRIAVAHTVRELNRKIWQLELSEYLAKRAREKSRDTRVKGGREAKDILPELKQFVTDILN